MIAVHQRAADELAIAFADAIVLGVGYHYRSIIDFIQSAAGT
ncbi:hypothetical protein [Bradyrhizobium macuxiense]|nr:hypothetical protein [Bradyrhizobium macuxiense]